MKFHKLFLSSVSACFELINKSAYKCEESYQVVVNGEILDKTYQSNVFSLFNLTPDTDYVVATTLSDFTLSFKTPGESACLNVLDFGAKADGKTMNTMALQTAINACPPRGRVLIPEGVYLTGALLLDSDLTVEIKKGAVLLGSTEPEDYPVYPGEIKTGPEGAVLQVSNWEGEPFSCHQSFLTAFYKKNIAVVGEGCLDGNAQNASWWINPKERAIGRPKMLFANQCENLIMHGMEIKNSPAWNLHPFFSKSLGFYDLHIMAPKDSPNTDGCDPESCNGVEIIGVRFSVGDDAIAIKAGKLYMGKKYKTPAQKHTIRNCLMEFAHGGVVLGSEMSGGVRDLDVRQCLFKGTDRGLRIKTRRGRGKDAIIDGIVFENIRMENVLTPLVVNMYYHCDPEGKTPYAQSHAFTPVDERTPYIGHFHFKDMICQDCEYAAGYFHGLPEQPIGGIKLENISFHMKKDAGAGKPAMMDDIDDFSKTGLYFNCVKEVDLKNVTFDGVEGPEIVELDVEKIRREG